MILGPPVWGTGSWADDIWADGTWATEAPEITLAVADYVVMVEASQQYVVVPPFEGVSTVSAFTTEVIPR